MDNAPKEIEQVKEPKRGIAPFADGFETSDGGESIQSKPFSFGGLGKGWVSLIGPKITEEEDWYEEEDLAFTIDLSGKISTGKALDFMRQGYCSVRGWLDFSEPGLNSDHEHNLRFNMWLDDTETTVSSDMGDRMDKTEDIFFFENDTGERYKDRYGDTITKQEHFMLKNTPEILQAIRVSISEGGEKNNGYKEFNYWKWGA